MLFYVPLSRHIFKAAVLTYVKLILLHYFPSNQFPHSDFAGSYFPLDLIAALCGRARRRKTIVYQHVSKAFGMARRLLR
jgi:hypothetical protein